MIAAPLKQGRSKPCISWAKTPWSADPDIHHVEKALKKLEFWWSRIFSSPRRPSWPMWCCPAASFAEKDGTFSNTERRVLKVRQAVEPAGRRIPPRLGDHPGPVHPVRLRHALCLAEAIMEEIGLTPTYGGITYARLEQGPAMALPHAGAPRHRLPAQGPFSRGKGALHRHRLQAAGGGGRCGISPLAHHRPAASPTTTTGTMTRRSRTLDELAPEGWWRSAPRMPQNMEVKDGERVTVSSRRGDIQDQGQGQPAR